MTYEGVIVLLGVVVIVAIPVNLLAVIEVRGPANKKPTIPVLTLLKRIVNLLATVATGIAMIGLASIVFILTNVKILPGPTAAVTLTVILLTVSYINLFILRFVRGLRQKHIDEHSDEYPEISPW